MDLLKRTKETSREVKVAIYVIVAISVLAFLLYEVRRHAVEQLALERTRIETAERQFATVIASVSSESPRVDQPLADGFAYIEDGKDNYLLWLEREGIQARRVPLPGRSSGKVETYANDDSGTVIVMSTGIQAERLAVASRAVVGERANRLPWNMVDTDRRFVLRGGRIVFVEHDAPSRTSVFFMAPLEMLLAGLPWALSAEIAVVGMLAFLLILIQESRTNENNIRRLLDASPVPLAMFDLASRDVVLANTAARELFGSAADGLPQAVVRQGLLRNPELLRRITGDASSIKALE